MEIINRQNSDKTQGKKIQIENKYTTISYFACFFFYLWCCCRWWFGSVCSVTSVYFVEIFLCYFECITTFLYKKKINYIFEFLIDFKWYPNILFQFNVFLCIFSILCCHFLLCDVIFFTLCCHAMDITHHLSMTNQNIDGKNSNQTNDIRSILCTQN